MKKLLSILLALASSLAFGNDIDLKLGHVIKLYGLQACAPKKKDELYKFGELLFNTKVMSGDRDMACATCHLKDKGLADGLPLAVGIGGEGEGEQRLRHGAGAIVSRNAFSLFGRGRLVVQNFFWDGKVDSSPQGQLFTPFGNEISDRFKSALAVAAILPLTERDEFLGRSSWFKSNELIDAAANSYYGDRYKALNRPIQSRLLEERAELERAEAWDIVSSPKFELADVGNALASFITSEFGCKDSSWERFLRGDHRALSASEKRGAVLFFGKARCASCHTPPSFSDGMFHSLGVPQGSFGPATRERDLGRAMVTNKREDLYRFRTPPLIAVSETAPYGHNGIFPALEDVVLHHVNPMVIYQKQPTLLRRGERLRSAKTLDTRDDRLPFVEIGDEEELADLLAFLTAL